MKPTPTLQRWAGLLAGILLAGSSLPAAATDPAVDWRFPVGIAYASGIPNVLDAIESQNFALENEFVLPVGLVFSPYAEFSFGLGVGLTVGPPSIILIDADYYDGFNSWNTDYASFVIPIGADLRYAFLRKSNVSPYVRIGLRYPIIAGDFLDGSTPGFYGGVGIEFLRQKRIAFGIEAGYDSSEIEVKSETRPWLENKAVKSAEFTVSVFAVF